MGNFYFHNLSKCSICKISFVNVNAGNLAFPLCGFEYINFGRKFLNAANVKYQETKKNEMKEWKEHGPYKIAFDNNYIHS